MALALNSRTELVMPLLGRQHATLLVAPKPASSIPRYKKQVKTIMQLL